LDDVDEQLLEKATRILAELPQRSPKIDEARVLADAMSLEDFSISGLLARPEHSAAQILDACEKREQYGYWDARLKDGFHFEPVRKLAARRLENVRKLMKLLAEEQP
jgi:hypothetical protein